MIGAPLFGCAPVTGDMTPNTPARDAAVSDETVAEITRAIASTFTAMPERMAREPVFLAGNYTGDLWPFSIELAKAAVNALPATLARMDQDAATIAGLRGVLEPFAKLAAETDAQTGVTSVSDQAVCRVLTTMGELRRARAALSDPRS